MQPLADPVGAELRRIRPGAGRDPQDRLASDQHRRDGIALSLGIRGRPERKLARERDGIREAQQREEKRP